MCCLYICTSKIVGRLEYATYFLLGPFSSWYITLTLSDASFHCRIKFGKVALKCRDCRAICHPECRESVPVPCVPIANTPTAKGQLILVSQEGHVAAVTWVGKVEQYTVQCTEYLKPLLFTHFQKKIVNVVKVTEWMCTHNTHATFRAV